MADNHIRLTVDLSQINKYMSELQQDRQIPFAISKALNIIATNIQSSIRQDMKSNMNLRREAFNFRMIKITSWAKKNNPTVEISLDQRAHWLARMEVGKDHTPFQGKQYLAVPNQAVFKNQVISSRNKLYIKNLSFHINDKGETVGNEGTFIIKSSSSSVPFIVQNLMQGRGKKRKENTRILYTLVRKTKQPVKLHFISIANRIINNDLTGMINEAMAYTLKTQTK